MTWPDEVQEEFIQQIPFVIAYRSMYELSYTSNSPQAAGERVRAVLLGLGVSEETAETEAAQVVQGIVAARAVAGLPT